ncbi:signal transduction histidine kinase [Amycolatopsis bartoniae]|uniref:histidine kinase n=1 Tax=Amycolatopsis bartoniae TaxID=941986 RepID=A0A8H9MBV0_9PSEU|nr:histidine kinase [Amycolatopsis bartoniae]MBB2939208.1 signal transduction histidine kinase [Amycolatopsis bartoniae]TVT09593.1 sensor histidine kinase [Amycolatopsis bartoniae]GHF38195.1 two-component sensor histidine kinase [Amycolatopsis bartoniae]
MSTDGLSIRIPVSGNKTAGRARAGALWEVLTRRTTWAPLAVDAAAILLAALDVWLVIPEKAEPYSIYLSAFACLALAARRWLPFAVVLGTVPGFLTGWSQLAAMIALGMLATRRQTHWQVWVGAALVWACRFIQWPLSDFAQLSWREHVLDGIYGVLVAGMPIAIGLLIGARAQLSQKLGELAASRDREQRLRDDAVRNEERARLAREMHDVVSHDITLIAMQAGVLAAGGSADAQETARVIRQLSTRTLEELRSLVGVLRSGAADDGPQPGIGELDQLVRDCEVPVQLTVDSVPDQLPAKVSAAAYRTVQECLTNVRKHAPGARATILILGDGDALNIEVRNDSPCRPATTLPSGGHGLTGLAERARLLGGSFETTSTDDGGFRVRAIYPVKS